MALVSNNESGELARMCSLAEDSTAAIHKGSDHNLGF